MDRGECHMLSQSRYPLDMNELLVEVQQKAEKELGETPEIREKKLKELREMTEEDDDVDIKWMTDDFLLMYLRCRKFDAKRAFMSLKHYVTFVKSKKSLFTVSDRVTDAFIRERMAYYLPYRDPEGCAVYVGFLDRWNPSEVPPDESLACHLLFQMKALSYPKSQVNVLKIILDAKSTSLKHLWSCTPYYAYTICYTFQEILPARPKGFHVVNASLPFRTFFAIISPLLPKKLRSRVFVHSSLSSLHEHFSTDILPKELGGTLEEHDFSEWARNARHPETTHRILNST